MSLLLPTRCFLKGPVTVRCFRAAFSPHFAVSLCKSFSSNIPSDLAYTENGSPEKSRKLWTLPNAITIARISSSPLLVYAIANDMKFMALAGCAVGAFSDWLDGYIAKNYNQQSLWGGILDPVADKVFIGCIASGLALKGLLPYQLLGIILGRDVFLVSCGMIIRAIERPSGAPFFDSSLDSATFEIVPTKLSKINTVLQFTVLAATLSHFALNYPGNVEILEPLWYLTGATTLISGFQYIDGSGIRKISVKATPPVKRFSWK